MVKQSLIHFHLICLYKVYSKSPNSGLVHRSYCWHNFNHHAKFGNSHLEWHVHCEESSLFIIQATNFRQNYTLCSRDCSLSNSSASGSISSSVYIQRYHLCRFQCIVMRSWKLLLNQSVFGTNWCHWPSSFFAPVLTWPCSKIWETLSLWQRQELRRYLSLHHLVFFLRLWLFLHCMEEWWSIYLLQRESFLHLIAWFWHHQITDGLRFLKLLLNYLTITITLVLNYNCWASCIKAGSLKTVRLESLVQSPYWTGPQSRSETYTNKEPAFLAYQSSKGLQTQISWINHLSVNYTLKLSIVSQECDQKYQPQREISCLQRDLPISLPACLICWKRVSHDERWRLQYWLQKRFTQV